MTAHTSSLAQLVDDLVPLLAGMLGDLRVRNCQLLQSLWGEQGLLLRLHLDAAAHETVIVKYIAPNRNASHPRGWTGARSFERKRRSYEVECHWYRTHAAHCLVDCRLPRLLGLHEDEHHTLLVLEDLQPAFPRLCQQLDARQLRPCLLWLAEFHARFMHHSAEGLWSRGSYWHLQTRPDEWQAMEPGAVRDAAHWLDQCLRQARFQTLIHGDAKLANFCFSEDLRKVAAVDFQYVGQGCGMSDVVCLMASSLGEQECRLHENELLDLYFDRLKQAMRRRSVSGENEDYRVLDASQAAGSNGMSGAIQSMEAERKKPDSDMACELIEQEWRSLYSIAWTDYHRFLSGWMPSHSRINSHVRDMADKALSDWPGTPVDPADQWPSS